MELSTEVIVAIEAALDAVRDIFPTKFSNDEARAAVATRARLLTSERLARIANRQLSPESALDELRRRATSGSTVEPFVGGSTTEVQSELASESLSQLMTNIDGYSRAIVKAEDDFILLRKGLARARIELMRRIEALKKVAPDSMPWL